MFSDYVYPHGRLPLELKQGLCAACDVTMAIPSLYGITYKDSTPKAHSR